MQVTLNTRVEADLRIRLDDYSKQTGKSIAAIVAEALEKHLSEDNTNEK